MEIKKDKKVIITGKKVCLVAGILSGICGLYWLAKALFYDETNLPIAKIPGKYTAPAFEG